MPDRTPVLFELTDFEAESGLAYVVSCPSETPDGDDMELHDRSRLLLLEDRAALGPAHSQHADIRARGGGAYSHWGRSIYFSASDNSDPRSNGRRYQGLWVSASAGEELTDAPPIVENHSTVLSNAIKRTALVPQSEIHAIHCARLLSIATSAMSPRRLGHVLEIGSYSHPGLAFLLLLMGADRVTLNNQKLVTNRLSAAYIENLTILTAHNPAVHKDWRRFLIEEDGGYRVRPEYLRIMSETDACRVNLAKELVDLVFSLSVLEHIRHLPMVLDHLRSLVRPGGAMWHWIDVRDHTSFADPLRYLRLSQDDFDTTYSGENNRWRPSDYLRMIEKAGFSTLDVRYLSQNPLNSGGTDILWFLREDWVSHLPLSIAEVDPWVDDETRAQLHSDFRSFSNSELSVVGLCALSERT